MAGEPDYSNDPVQGYKTGDLSSINMVASPTIPNPPPLTQPAYGGPFQHIAERTIWLQTKTAGTYPPGVWDKWR